MGWDYNFKPQPFTEEERCEAFEDFANWFTFRGLDPAVETFLTAAPRTNWLREARQASLKSIRQAARNMKVSKTTYAKYEKAEANGSIRLEQLRRCAEALDCELVYSIRPKRKTTFTRRVARVLLEKACADSHIQGFQTRRSWHLARIMKRLLFTPAFRRAQGWTKNTEGAARYVVYLLDGERTIWRKYYASTGCTAYHHERP